MQIGDTLSPLGGASAGSARQTGKDTLGKEDFLRLLTTQLSNQDPLNPMDNTAFVSQMAEFSGLEQLMNMGEAMGQLAVAQAIGNGTDMVSFIGKEVSYLGDTVQYTPPGDQPVGVELEGPASVVTVSVYDDTGKLVKTIESKGAFAKGSNEIVWDGTDAQGLPVPEGEYSFKVSAQDADGGAVGASTRLKGVVEGVTYASGFPELIIGGKRVPVGQVMEVLDASSGARSGGEGSEPGSSAPMVSAEVVRGYRDAR